MKAKHWIAVLAIVAVALGIGIGIGSAVLPSTPTWTIWRVTRAVNERDTRALLEQIDVPAVAASTVEQLGEGTSDGTGFSFGRLAGALLGGNRITTILDKDAPNKPHIGLRDVLAAWWSMERRGDEARVELPLGDRTVSLLLSRRTGAWKIAGIRPLSALIEIGPKG